MSDRDEQTGADDSEGPGLLKGLIALAVFVVVFVVGYWVFMTAYAALIDGVTAATE
jgi:hypothetical protein